MCPHFPWHYKSVFWQGGLPVDFANRGEHRGPYCLKTLPRALICPGIHRPANSGAICFRIFPCQCRFQQATSRHLFHQRRGWSARVAIPGGMAPMRNSCMILGNSFIVPTEGFARGGHLEPSIYCDRCIPRVPASLDLHRLFQCSLPFEFILIIGHRFFERRSHAL